MNEKGVLLRETSLAEIDFCGASPYDVGVPDVCGGDRIQDAGR